MKIAVFGAGAIGCLVGTILSNNNEVTLIGRKKLVENFDSRGIVIQGLTNTISKNLKVSENLNGEFDLIIFTVKSFDTEKTIKSIANNIQGTYLLSLQNGIDNIETIKKYKSNQLLAAITTQGAYSLDYGKIVHTGKGITKIGAISADTENFAKDLVKKFNSAGLETEYSSSIINDIWTKGAVNACINPITGILSIKNGEIMANDHLHRLLVELSKECNAILELKGIKEDLLSLTEEVIRNTAGNYSSMVQDLKKGSLTEIDHINRVFIDEGMQSHIIMPYNNSLYYMIKYLEKIKKS
jgi:2-dehydropantoate 2-reductase